MFLEDIKNKNSEIFSNMQNKCLFFKQGSLFIYYYYYKYVKLFCI